MRIGLVTIYKCYNFGSFYQAYGLQQYLEKLGHEVEFLDLDTDYNKHFRLRKQLNRDISRDYFSLRVINGYIRDWKLYNIAKEETDQYDLIIIGSDELWNIHNRSFTPLPEYYGINLPCDNVITYASCVGRARIDSFEKNPNLLDGIKRIKEVSVRDDSTESFVSALRPDRKATRVVDPSFLGDWSLIEKPCKMKDFILVYTYDGEWGFSEENIQRTKEFAKKMELPLVSVGFRNTWCDKWVAGSPRKFLGYLKNASYVVTDTFHGTAMSIQYQKEFISLGQGKDKVESLLKEFGLYSRLYTENNDFETVFSRKSDFASANIIIQKRIKESKGYLSKFI